MSRKAQGREAVLQANPRAALAEPSIPPPAPAMAGHAPAAPHAAPPALAPVRAGKGLRVARDALAGAIAGEQPCLEGHGMVLPPTVPEEGLTCRLSGTQLVSLHFCAPFGSAREMPRDKEVIASGKSSWKGLTKAMKRTKIDNTTGRCCTWLPTKTGVLHLHGVPKRPLEATRKELLHYPCKH